MERFFYLLLCLASAVPSINSGTLDGFDDVSILVNDLINILPSLHSANQTTRMQKKDEDDWTPSDLELSPSKKTKRNNARRSISPLKRKRNEEEVMLEPKKCVYLLIFFLLRINLLNL